jgi:hypothetical protein
MCTRSPTLPPAGAQHKTQLGSQKTRPYLKLHYVSAGGRPNQASADVGVILVECANVARALIVVHHLSQPPKQLPERSRASWL